ncbi:unnamed protein product [Pleuronectes platessa]|uniref:Uncharacterized protein n=1 Tax=Pleuronectes platessa TaxID=8262 RepID=A0A9N7VTA2_PLEPL|nr:unnamed protein product [Pleuronectes platessa]
MTREFNLRRDVPAPQKMNLSSSTTLRTNCCTDDKKTEPHPPQSKQGRGAFSARLHPERETRAGWIKHTASWSLEEGRVDERVPPQRKQRKSTGRRRRRTGVESGRPQRSEVRRVTDVTSGSSR